MPVFGGYTARLGGACYIRLTMRTLHLLYQQRLLLSMRLFGNVKFEPYKPPKPYSVLISRCYGIRLALFQKFF